MILCVFLTFSTVNAVDLTDSSFNSTAIDSQSESSFTNLNEDTNIDIVKINEDEDCVESMNELSNLNDDLNEYNDKLSINNGLKSSLGSINSDENSLKSTLSPSGNTFSSIQDSITNAKSGDTINLNGKTFKGNGTAITINKSLTIIGGTGSSKATLDAMNMSGIIRVSGANLKLVNCIFMNANTRSVYYISGNGSISNCEFKNNYGETNAAHLIVKNDCSNFLLENSKFMNGLTCVGSNVAIASSNSTVRNCSFINNTARSNKGEQVIGGGLMIGANVNATNIGSVINCQFINNSVVSSHPTTHGGALCFRPGIKVYNTSFINNYCNNYGGATTLHSDGELFNCVFINNSAGVYGGAITTGLLEDDITVNISSCIFENNSAPMGGAIQIKGNNVKIVNSTFNGNRANKTDGGALFIMGNKALILNSSFDENFAKSIGAGILINGSDVSILNSSFNRNIANYGAAIYVVGSNANLFSSNFTNHKMINGSVYIKGTGTYVYDCDFSFNQGENGAAAYILGSNSNLILNDFLLNNVSRKGGAVYIEGSNANCIASIFLNNSAIPLVSDISTGLAGALYIKGDNNAIDSSNFSYNIARNGSAIYTDGHNLTISNTAFDKNQAWSYILDCLADPARSYFNESDIKINLTLIGGNNIANAIYNAALIDDILFYNVSYMSSKGLKITGDDEIHPVKGAQNSNDGQLLYQDDREDNQLINLIIYGDSAENDDSKSSDSSQYSDNGILTDSDFPEDMRSQDIILNRTFTTGILGDVNFNLSDYVDLPLKAGNYRIYAKHFEDDFYKEIEGTDDFEIVPIVDLAIGIASSRVNIDFNKTVKYTIKVDNYGPNNATNAYVNASIPEGLVYLSSSASVGTYDERTGIWDIGDLNIGENQTLILNVLTNKTGSIDFPVEISSDEEDTNLSNNFNNKSIRVLMADLSIDVKASGDEFNFGDSVDWIITIRNNGPNNASKIIVSVSSLDDDMCYLNSSDDSFDSENFIWQLPSLLVDDERTLVITTKVNSSNKTIGLIANVCSDTFDPIMSNNIDEDNIDLLPLCDLIIKVNMSDDLADYGDKIDLLVLVSNDGPDDAYDVAVDLSDLESLGLLADIDDDSFDLETYQWKIGDLANGKSVSLTIPLEVKSSNKALAVEGTVNSSTFELNRKNNHDSANLTMNPLCDLAIDISLSNSTIRNGDIFDLLVVVSNDGPDDGKDVAVSLSDLNGLGIYILEFSDDAFNRDGNEWSIGNLGNGESVSLSIKAKANRSSENITIISEVETSTFELNKENNLDNDSLKVLPLCDLTVSIYPENELVKPGDNVNWIINVTNKGPDTANNVTVFNSLPEGLEYVLSQSSKGELENFTDDDGAMEFIWKLGDLNNDESAYLIISTDALEEGMVINEVNANSSTDDLNESNNFDSSSLKVAIEDDSNQGDNDSNGNGGSDDGSDDGSGDGSGNSSDDGSDSGSDDGWNDGFDDDDGSNSYDDLDDGGSDDEGFYEGYPIFDYFNNGKNDGYDGLGKNHSNDSNSKGNDDGDGINSISISNKNTGNPLVFAAFSILALLVLSFRKIRF